MANHSHSPEQANLKALRLIQEWARKSDVEEWLNLDGLGLTQVPSEVCRLTSLKRLDLGSNRLTALPPEIGQLTGLNNLLLYSNQLTTLPAEIGKLNSLTLLHLHGNQLTALPAEIGQLASLEFLNLGGNRLLSLPPEIGQLLQLKRAILSENRLRSIPPEICELERLQTLYLHGNSSLGIPLDVLGATCEEESKGKKSAPSRSILNYYFRAHPELRLSANARRNLANAEESHDAFPGASAHLESCPGTETIAKPFEVTHEMVLNRKFTVAAWPTILFGALVTAVGVIFLFARSETAMISLFVFLPIGVPSLLLGLYASRSPMERERVSIRGTPPQIRVRRFRAPKRVSFDDPRAKVILDRQYRTSDIEWVSVDVGTVSDDGDSDSRKHTYYYWHPIVKPKDLPPKILGTFSAGGSEDEQPFKLALEEAGALGKEVARVLDVPFRWDECPSWKNDPSWKYSIYKAFTEKKWDWPWSVPEK